MPGRARALCAAGQALWLSPLPDPRSIRASRRRGPISPPSIWRARSRPHALSRASCARWWRRRRRCGANRGRTHRSTPRRSRASASRSTRPPTKAGPGASCRRRLCRLAADGSAARDAGQRATHKVAALRTLVFPGPSIKLPPIESLSFGCRLAIARIEPPFAVTAPSGFVPLRHLVDDRPSGDRFRGGRRAVPRRALSVGRQDQSRPRLLGARATCRSPPAGMPCSRDSDMQERSLAGRSSRRPISPNLQRGDLMFWQGHVAIVRDSATLIHANAPSHGGCDRADRGGGRAHPRPAGVASIIERPPAARASAQ